MKVFNSNFLSAMHGFQDKEVLLQAGFDVIVISPLRGVSHRFCWRNLKKPPQFQNGGSLTYFAYLFPFQSYSTFYFGWLLPFPTHFRVVFRIKHP